MKEFDCDSTTDNMVRYISGTHNGLHNWSRNHDILSHFFSSRRSALFPMRVNQTDKHAWACRLIRGLTAAAQHGRTRQAGRRRTNGEVYCSVFKFQSSPAVADDRQSRSVIDTVSASKPNRGSVSSSVLMNAWDLPLHFELDRPLPPVPGIRSSRHRFDDSMSRALFPYLLRFVWPIYSRSFLGLSDSPK
jgi:hypothetical protein